MVDNVVPTLAPEKRASEVLESRPAPWRPAPLDTEKNALFDSLAKEGLGEESPTQNTPLQTFLTALLWTGYGIAIVVALVLVWSAANGLLKSLPR